MKIYCLTIAGSERHEWMQYQLDQLKAVNYEFIFGKTASDVPFRNVLQTPYGHPLQNPNNIVDKKELQNIEHCFSTKAGMVEAFEKIADDLFEDEWAFFVQDDICILPDYESRAKRIIAAHPPMSDGICVTYNPYHKKANQYKVVVEPFCTETAMLLKPSFARRYAEANKACNVEADMAMLLANGEQHLLSPIPMATLRCVHSMIRNAGTEM